MFKTFQVVNDLVNEGIIKTYAVGGAIAAINYVQPFTTEDVDVFISVAVGSAASGLMTLSPLYEHLARKGYHPKNAYVEIGGWDVQFLPVFNPLIEEAVDNAIEVDVNGVPVRIMTAEYLVAIMLEVGRPKDFARVRMFIEQEKVNKNILNTLIERFRLEESWRKYRLSL